MKMKEQYRPMYHPEPEPMVGMGATEICWSDRYPFKIIEVKRDKNGIVKSIKVQSMKHRADPTKDNGIGHNNWILEDDPDGHVLTLKWRQRKQAWYSKGPDGKGWMDRFKIGYAEYHYGWSL